MIQIVILLLGAAIFLFFTGNAMGDISEITNLKSGLMVLGGTLMCAFLAYPLKTFKDLSGSLVELFRNEEKENEDVLSQIETLAHVRWLYGVREMEQEAKKGKHPFIRKGISLVADDYDRFEIYNILEKDLELFYSKRTSQINILETLGKLAPAFGFVGTIIGLIGVLSNMQNPAEIGKGMSIALLTTLYGSLISNFVFLPLGRKLSRIHQIPGHGTQSDHGRDHGYLRQEKSKGDRPPSQVLFGRVPFKTVKEDYRPFSCRAPCLESLIGQNGEDIPCTRKKN